MSKGVASRSFLLVTLIFLLPWAAMAWAGPNATPRAQAARVVITSPEPFTTLRGQVFISGTPTPLPPTPMVVIELNEWSTPVNVSNTSMPSQLPRVAVDPFGSVHVVWTEAWSQDGGAGSILYSRQDGGAWTTPLRISTDDTEPALLPAIAVTDRGVVHVVFSGGEAARENDYLYHTYTAYTRDSGQASEWWKPGPVADSRGVHWSDIQTGEMGSLHVAWSVDEPPSLHYAVSFDGGLGWEEASALMSPERQRLGVPEGVRLAVDGRGIPYVVWHAVRPDSPSTASVACLSAGMPRTTSDDRGVVVLGDWETDILMWSGAWPGVSMGIDYNVALVARGILDFPDGTHEVLAFQRWPLEQQAEILQLPAQSRLGDDAYNNGWVSIALDGGGTKHIVFASQGQLYHVQGYERTRTDPALLTFRVVGAAWPDVAVGNGNRLHLVWTQPSEIENQMNVYYSTSETLAPHVPSLLRPTLTPTVTPTATGSPDLEVTPSPSPSDSRVNNLPPDNSRQGPIWKTDSPTSVLLLSLSPVVFLVGALVIARAFRNRRV